MPHKRTPKGKKKRELREDLYTQQRASRKYISDNEFKDRVNGETVNQVTSNGVSESLRLQFGGVIQAAVPADLAPWGLSFGATP